jgi:hypothetical protein
MTSFNVSVSESEKLLLIEFLKKIGARYTEVSDNFELSDEQKAFLDSQDNIQWSDCINHEDLVNDLKKEYGF